MRQIKPGMKLDSSLYFSMPFAADLEVRHGLLNMKGRGR